MLCEAVWRVEIELGGGPASGQAQVWSKDLCAGWSFGQPFPVELSRTKDSQSKKQVRRQNGCEDLNLFAWTCV